MFRPVDRRESKRRNSEASFAAAFPESMSGAAEPRSPHAVARTAIRVNATGALGVALSST